MLNFNHAFSGFSVDDLEKARAFYSETLGLKVTDDDGALRIYLDEDTFVYVYGKPNHEPASFTVLNFKVADIEAAVQQLKDSGVTFEQYPGTDTGEDGISRSSQGPSIAWFKDPAGNILSVLQAD